MTLVYPVHDGLYVNLTNKCPCACEFCIRNNGKGAYGSDSLWLEREPTAGEVVAAIENAINSSNFSNPSNLSNFPYDELVFCGYGEPTERLDVLVEVAKRVKATWPGTKIRVNTNGLSDLINGGSTAAKFAGAVDVISVSLNAPTTEEYVALCHPKFGLAAFPAILKFTGDVKNFVPSVMMTVVATPDFTDDKRKACEAICRGLGVPLRIRTLVAN